MTPPAGIPHTMDETGEAEYWTWRADCICQGCGATPDEAHTPTCAMWLATLEQDW